MKTIFKYIALTALAIICGLNVSAQNLPEGTYEGKNGIAYRKSSALKPGTTDTYVVNLETFVYGAVTVKNVSVPADIVLVLDVSGSMDETMYEHVYTARSSQAYSYDGYGDNAYYYKHTDGKYYLVRRGSYRTGAILRGQYHTYLYYVVNGKYYYLSGNSVVEERPENPSYGWINWFFGSHNTTIWTGVLYNVQQIDRGSKMDNLKIAVNAFIDAIQHNDLYDDDDQRRVDENNQSTSLGNQISIVKFASDQYYQSIVGYNSNDAPTAAGDHRGAKGNNNYNYTEVVRGFTTTATDANVTSLKNSVNSLQAGGATAADYGLNLARLLLRDIQASRPESNKTVVFFTDGSPTYGNAFSDTVAGYAINNAYQIKSTYDAMLFTVGVFENLVTVNPDEGTTDETELQNVNTYMSRVSSNYPDAVDFTSPSTPLPVPQQTYYQNVITGTDLTSVFQSIAEASGGSGATEVTSESTVTVDVVASSFSLPSGISADDITVTVAPCTGYDKDNHASYKEDIGGGKERLYLEFGENKASTEYNLPAITPEVDPDHNMVTTTGFDFSSNWCGLDESLGSEGEWRGYKQTISFEIKLNDSAVGGPNVVTNDRKSGIYVNGNPVAEFNRPVVKVPVSIWIMKKGLLGDDSAVFNVQYAKYEEGVDPTSLPSSAWKSFTKVIVNSNDPKEKNPHDTSDNEYYPIVKLVGLDPDYFYRIKEDAWAWTYTYVADGIQYVFGENQQNPFVFTNIPQPNIKSGEGSVKNEFNPGSSSSK